MVTLDDLINEGYRVRPAKMDDLEEAVNLYNICSHTFLGSDECRPDEIQQEWELLAFDLESATRVVHSPEGNMVGYIEVWDIKDPPVNTYIWGRVHPDWENKGIGKAMMEWGENRAREAISRTPDHARVVMRSFVFSTYPYGIRMLEDAGMRLIRHVYRMRIDIDTQPPPPQWPDGIQLRPFDLDRDAKAVYLADEDAFKDHWGHVDEPFEAGFERWLHFASSNENVYDPDLWYIAMDEDEIAGLAICIPESSEDPKMGWVESIGVRRPWRRRGLALALLHHTFLAFYNQGQESVGLSVDASNLTGATRLYEKAGMHVVRRLDNYEKELRPGTDISVETISQS